MLIESKWASALLLAATLLAGCTTTPHRAPVEDRTPSARPQAGSASSPGSAASAPAEVIVAKPLPGAENAGKPGYYAVKPGDTLIRIGLESGQSSKDLIKWNSLENGNVIEVGQVLRVVPPGVDGAGAATKPIASSRIEARPLDAKPLPAGASAPPAAAATSASTAASASTVVVPAIPAATSGPASASDEDVRWAWPANGSVVAPFDDSKNKGLLIGGKAGDPVYAAADGRVVYAGSGLRGYGNLIILKHNNTYLTAYAHNQALLVKEDQSVRRGQKIAEMGSTDSDSVKLHFEIRKMGKPIDPAKLLPPR
ncbi:MAG TPA: peptidoglycan DD-metalloendopeptidase family protein [Burkholderiaceae bacterium]|jgi:lipoprotein NlpD